MTCGGNNQINDSKSKQNKTPRKRKIHHDNHRIKRIIKEVDIQLQDEFQTLKSLIPGIAEKSHISELDIIDASVNYIEVLQDQLRRHDPDLLDLVAEEVDNQSLQAFTNQNFSLNLLSQNDSENHFSVSNRSPPQCNNRKFSTSMLKVPSDFQKLR